MKKFLLTIMSMLMLGAAANAESVKVYALEDFSTENPKDTFAVQLATQKTLDNGKILDEGTNIFGQVIKVKNATRGKQNAYFVILPYAYSINDTTTNVTKSKVKIKVVPYSEIDAGDVALNVGKTAGGFFIKGLSQGVSFVQGVAEAEDGQRLKSGVTKVYKDSPLSYVEKGEELNIKKGDELSLKIYKIKDNDEK